MMLLVFIHIHAGSRRLFDQTLAALVTAVNRPARDYGKGRLSNLSSDPLSNVRRNDQNIFRQQRDVFLFTRQDLVQFYLNLTAFVFPWFKTKDLGLLSVG